jgi:hypothetical protein
MGIRFLTNLKVLPTKREDDTLSDVDGYGSKAITKKAESFLILPCSLTIEYELSFLSILFKSTAEKFS